jgi:hypothetical protein
MSDELNDLLEEEAPSPDDVDDNNEVEDGVDEEDVDEDEEEEQTVPLAALKAERDKRKNYEQQLDLYRTQLQMFQNQQTQKKEPDPFDELDDGELLTKEHYLKGVSKFKNEVQEQIGQLIMNQKYPDFENVMREYLDPMIAADPDLLEIIKNAPPSKRYDIAYKLAKTNPNFKNKDNKKVDTKSKSKKIIKNSKKVKSPSTVSDSSAGGGNRYSDMSEDDILKEALKVIGEG